jgi:purine-binding chemotaxis protein CheW
MNDTTIETTGEAEDFHQILEKRARIMARAREAEIREQDVLQLLTFPMGEERFGLDMQFVREIQPLKRQMWSLVPCTPDFIVGAVNIRGRIYSMMNVAAYLKINAGPISEIAHAVLIRGRTEPEKRLMEFCILADDRPGLENVPMSGIQSASSAVSSGVQAYIKGVTQSMLMILDIEKLISDPGIIINDENG